MKRVILIGLIVVTLMTPALSFAGDKDSTNKNDLHALLKDLGLEDSTAVGDSTKMAPMTAADLKDRQAGVIWEYDRIARKTEKERSAQHEHLYELLRRVSQYLDSIQLADMATSGGDVLPSDSLTIATSDTLPHDLLIVAEPKPVENAPGPAEANTQVSTKDGTSEINIQELRDRLRQLASLVEEIDRLVSTQPANGRNQ